MGPEFISLLTASRAHSMWYICQFMCVQRPDHTGSELKLQNCIDVLQ